MFDKVRPYAVVFVETVTWVLFGIATFLLARQTWYAVQGLQPDYSSLQAAYIVAGIVTATWIVMLVRLVLQIDRTAVDWLLSLSLFLFGLGVDIAVALSLVFEWVFPVHLALLVIVAHVMAHAIQWIVASAQTAMERFGKDYQSPEQKLKDKEQELSASQAALAASEVAKSMLEQAQSALEATHQQAISDLKAQHHEVITRLQEEVEHYRQLDEQRRAGLLWTCPDCGREFKHFTEDALNRAKTTHLNQRCPKRAVATLSNGKH